jgi:hypothetical protein
MRRNAPSRDGLASGAGGSGGADDRTFGVVCTGVAAGAAGGGSAGRAIGVAMRSR